VWFLVGRGTWLAYELLECRTDWPIRKSTLRWLEQSAVSLEPPLSRGILVFVLGVPGRNLTLFEVLEELKLPGRSAGRTMVQPRFVLRHLGLGPLSAVFENFLL